MSKATKRQMVEREDDIQIKLAKGLDIKDFSAELATKHRCAELSITKQYRTIIKAMVAIQKENRGELKVTLMMRNDHLYRTALAKGNIKYAMDAINLQAKIGGLYEAEKIEEKKKTLPQFRYGVD